MTFLADDFGMLINFVISFVIIAMFWNAHHRVFLADTPATRGSMWVNYVWMLAIVFLPVATGFSSAFASSPIVIAFYIGTMCLAAWMQVALTAFQRRDRIEAGLLANNRAAIATPLAMAILFMLALVVAMVFHDSISYYALFLLALTHPVRVLLIRLGLTEPGTVDASESAEISVDGEDEQA